MPRTRSLTRPTLEASPTSIPVTNSQETIRGGVLEIIRRETMSTFDTELAPGTFGRLPIVVSFRILPVQFDGSAITLRGDWHEGGVALTRDVSGEGVAFQHPAPLEERFALAFFSALETMDLALLFERLWTKALQPVEHLSGGRFVGAVSLSRLPQAAEVA